MTERFTSLEFTPTFVASLFRMRPNVGELAAVIDLLDLLDDDPHALALNVHDVPDAIAGLRAAEGRSGVRVLFLERPGAVHLLVCARETQD